MLLLLGGGPSILGVVVGWLHILLKASFTKLITACIVMVILLYRVNTRKRVALSGGPDCNVIWLEALDV